MKTTNFRKRGIILSLFLFYWLGFCALINSCSFLTEMHAEKITIRLPSIPHETKNILSFSEWELLYFDNDKSFIVKRFPISQKQIEITIQKNKLTPFLCYPLLDHETTLDGIVKPPGLKNKMHLQPFFKPAGSIYPLGVSTNRDKNISLTWQKGFAAWFLFNAITLSHASHSNTLQMLSIINWQKFQIQTEKFANPWEIDTVKIYSAIENEKIATYSFKALEKTISQVIIPSTNWVHSSYMPLGFLHYSDYTRNSSVNLQVPVGDMPEKILTNKNIYYLSIKNDSKRLVITSIPY